MMEKLKKENTDFVESWEKHHKNGFIKYFSEKTPRLGLMMLMLYFVNILIHKDSKYFLLFIIYLCITLTLPVIAWKINEVRYRQGKITE